MKLYRLTDDVDALGLASTWRDGKPHWCATLAEAHAEAKANPNAVSIHCDIRIELIRVSSDKASVVSYLNGGQPYTHRTWADGTQATTIERTWKLGPRFGLVECPNGE